jgi:hypothetical protein
VPDSTGLTALDVAIGLFFLYFVLSVVCSAVVEMISANRRWRATNCRRAIDNLVGEDKKDAFWADERISVLEPPPRQWDWIPGLKDPGGPSYVPAQAFALTALKQYAPDLATKAKRTDPDAPSAEDLVFSLRATVSLLPNGAVKTALNDALDDGRTSFADFRASVEASYDAVMDRASGWYKRRAQFWLVVVATVITLAGNVDSVQVARGLWNDDALRAAAVTAASDGERAATTETVSDEGVEIPIGWSNDAHIPDGNLFTWDGAGDWAIKWLGLAITILAVSMGAPFWFDVLGKFARLRATGNREGTAKSNERAAEDRDDPSGKRPAGT